VIVEGVQPACDCWIQTSVAGNAARQWPLIAEMHVVLTVWKKHGWICSNGSTSLKNPLLVGDWV